jgi:Flp pilus assembly protein TadG
MKLFWRKAAWIKTVGRSDGSEIAEAALVLPLMFMMLMGIFWFGQAFRISGTIAHAARQGARAAVAAPCTTCGGATTPAAQSAQAALNAYSAVQSALLAAKLDPSLVSQPATAPALCTCGSTDSKCTGGTVASCDGSQTTVCVETNVQLSFSNSTPGGAGVCGMSVSFRYPYTFWLPGSSLNKQNLLLPAQAEMRAEQQ